MTDVPFDGCQPDGSSESFNCLMILGESSSAAGAEIVSPKTTGISNLVSSQGLYPEAFNEIFNNLFIAPKTGGFNGVLFQPDPLVEPFLN